MDHTSDALASIFRQYGGDLASPGVDKQSEDGAESGCRENTVVKLYQTRVLQHVSPPQVGSVFLARVELIPQFRGRRCQPESHLREFIVDQTSIKAGDQGTRKHGGEDEGRKGGHGTSERDHGGVPQCFDQSHGVGGIGEEPACPEYAEAGKQHPRIAHKSGGEMGCESVLAHSRVRTRCEQVILEARLDHPPTDEALETNKAGDSNEGPSHRNGDATTGDEVGGRKDE